MELTQDFIEGFVAAKPDEDYKGIEIEKLIVSGHPYIFTRKRDGWKLYVLIDKDNVIRIYTSGGERVDHKIPHIAAQLRALGFGPNTLLAGEGVIEKNGYDLRGALQSVMKIKSADEAMNLQQEYGRVKLVLFSAFFNCGTDLANRPYDQVLSALRLVMDSAKGPDVSVVETVYVSTLEEARKRVLDHKWEGLVVYYSGYLLTYRRDGKECKRPKGCYKWKPVYEGDFIIRPEDHITHEDGTFKEAVLRQKDPVNPKVEYDCFHLGNFSARNEAYVAGIKKAIVVEVAFESRNEATGKLHMARFVRFRDDKPVRECRAPKSYEFPKIKKKKAVEYTKKYKK